MGQSQISNPSPSSTPRIQPTPGSSGLRNKKGTISVYCESSCTIFTYKSLPDMTVKDLKALIQNDKCDLILDNLVLNEDLMIESLDLEAGTLIKMVINNSHLCKSSSTVDSLQDLDPKKTFGPHSKLLEKLEKPLSDSILQTNFEPEKGINFFLKAFSVPDVKLKTSLKKRRV